VIHQPNLGVGRRRQAFRLTNPKVTRSLTPVSDSPNEVLVVIPARNESATIAECLESIDQAAERVLGNVQIVLAADSCTDQTVATATATAADLTHASLTVICGAWRAAGAARAAGVDLGLGSCQTPLHQLWIANTDADCKVPRDWLERQLRLARRFDALAGIVELESRTTPAYLMDGFRATYHTDGNTHSHVHGANLGVRASAYVRAGGWNPATSVGEDHELWNALIAGRSPVRQDAHLRVLTSARTVSRVEGGFATNLRMIEPHPGLVPVGG
jgi:glycosyltransferase involved in cell wall biosynthesis